MDTSSSSSLAAIIGPQFCAPHPVQLVFNQKAYGLRLRRRRKLLTVTDISGNVLFKTKKSTGFSFIKQRIILINAASGNPLVSMEKKLMDSRTWHVFAGDSFEPKDLLFTVERTLGFKIDTQLNVFLAANTNPNACDFKVEGNLRKKSCKVVKSDSSAVIAQMSEEHNTRNMQLLNGAFAVGIDPNIDSAFIAALIVIRQEFHVEARRRIIKPALAGGLPLPSLFLNLNPGK